MMTATPSILARMYLSGLSRRLRLLRAVHWPAAVFAQTA